jgi:two-component system sensor histidine kinase/response regulator
VLFEAGIDNYISKPFELEQVQRLLKYGFQARTNKDMNQPEILGKEVQSEKVLDIQRGMIQVGGDEDTYRELLEDFIVGLPRRLRTIQGLFASQDLVELSRAAHNLQGIAANLGAAELTMCVRKLDRQTAEGYTEALASLIQEFQLVVIKLLEVSNNFLAKKKTNLEAV